MPNDPSPETEAPAAAGETPFEWAIVEIFGHRKHAGRAREEEKFGAKLLRVDVPKVTLSESEDDKPAALTVTAWVTHFYGGSAIFSFTLTDEPTVLAINKPYQPPARYSLPAPAADDFEDMEI